MLQVAYSLRELDFSGLMAVYAGSTGGRLQAEQDFYQYLQEGFFDRPGDCCCLWEVDGHPVSALRLQGYRDGLLLEALETAPAYRRKGHAKALIMAVLTRFSGRKIYAHVEKKNRASLVLHEACGFREISDMAVFADGSVTAKAVTYLYE